MEKVVKFISNKINSGLSNKILVISVFSSLFVVNFFAPNLLTRTEITLLVSEIAIIRMFFFLPRLINRIVTVRKSGDSINRQIASIFPTQVIGLAKLELAQQKGFIAWILNKKNSCKENGEVFTHWYKSQYPTIFAIVILASITDIPFSIFLIQILFKNDPSKIVIHFFIISSTIYALVWLIADRYLVKNSYHIVDDEGLHLTIGARFTANIPWESITDVALIKEPKKLVETRKNWLLRNSFPLESTVIATPMDEPNIILKFKYSNLVNIEKFKIHRNNVDTLLLYLDEPRIFLNEVKKRITANPKV
jgi:hypothetical protein